MRGEVTSGVYPELFEPSGTVLRDAISGTKAILKKLLECPPGFSAGASAVEYLH